MSQAIFYPGPSRVYAKVPQYLLEAYSKRIMSINHRSEEFMDLAAKTKLVLRQKLAIPDDYEIVFTSSATECWEIIAQSLTMRKSHHFFNGAFGEKWKNRAAQLVDTVESSFDLNAEIPTEELSDSDVFCLTQNETSNGTMVSMDTIKKLRDLTDELICVDATSSMGGILLDFSLADVWYASVQKCFGLPAGMGILLLSPRALRRAEKIGDKRRYNSLLNIIEHWQTNQSPYTPNVLGLYLLYRTQNKLKEITQIEEKLTGRMTRWSEFIHSCSLLNFLVQNETVRSKTVLALTVNNPEKVIAYAKEAGIILGKGYGPWKEDTIRIANFPAIKRNEVAKAMKFLGRYR